MFELSSLALNETTALHIKHPVSGELLYADEDKKKPVVAHLYGPSSKVYRAANLKLRNRAIKRQASKQKLTAEQIEQEGIGFLVACSDKIDNLAFNGSPVDCPEAFNEMYTNPKFDWLKSQIDECIGDTANFLEA